MYIAPALQQRWNNYVASAHPGLIEALSIHITELRSGVVKASMPVTDTVKQPFGMLHGGASVTLAETLASLGSHMLITPELERASGIEINASHLCSVREGSVHADASIIHQGQRMHVWEVRIRDDQKRLVSICRCTIAIIS